MTESSAENELLLFKSVFKYKIQMILQSGKHKVQITEYTITGVITS